MSSLSSKVLTLEVISPASHPPSRVGFQQVPAEPWGGDTSSPKAATSKAGEPSTSLPASTLVSLLLLPLTLIQAAILLMAQRAAQQQASEKIQHPLLDTAQGNHPSSLHLASAVHKQTSSFPCIFERGEVIGRSY